MEYQEQTRAEFLNLQNDFERFNEYCAFLCDAMSSLCYEYKDNEPDVDTLMGARLHLSKLKYQAEELKNTLERIGSGL